MSSTCGIRLVESQARAHYVTHFTDLNYSISRVSYVHSSRTTDESLHYFVLQKTKTLDFEFQFILNSRIETGRHLVQSDFFCKDLHKTLKYVDEFPA